MFNFNQNFILVSQVSILYTQNTDAGKRYI